MSLLHCTKESAPPERKRILYMKRWHRICKLSLCVIAASPIASSQQESGTIVLLRLMPDHAIVAADSMTDHFCPGPREKTRQRIVSYALRTTWPIASKVRFILGKDTTA